MADKKKADRPAEGGSRQVNFRPSPSLYRRLERVANALELDVSGVVRMILIENMANYERRAEQIEQERENPR